MISIAGFSAENCIKWRRFEAVNNYICTIKIFNSSLADKEIANYLSVIKNMVANRGNPFLGMKMENFRVELKLYFCARC